MLKLREEGAAGMRCSVLVAVLLGLVVSGAACAQDAAGEEGPPLTRMDLVRCMSHVERASQAAMLKNEWVRDAREAAACEFGNADHLDAAARDQLQLVYDLFHLQIGTPSATVHMEVISESQKLLRMVR